MRAGEDNVVHCQEDHLDKSVEDQGKAVVAAVMSLLLGLRLLGGRCCRIERGGSQVSGSWRAAHVAFGVLGIRGSSVFICTFVAVINNHVWRTPTSNRLERPQAPAYPFSTASLQASNAVDRGNFRGSWKTDASEMCSNLLSPTKPIIRRHDADLEEVVPEAATPIRLVWVWRHGRSLALAPAG